MIQRSLPHLMHYWIENTYDYSGIRNDSPKLIQSNNMHKRNYVEFVFSFFHFSWLLALSVFFHSQALFPNWTPYGISFSLQFIYDIIYSYVHKFFCCYSQNRVFVVGLWCIRCQYCCYIYIPNCLYACRVSSEQQQ